MYSEIQRVVNTSSEEMMAKYQVSQVLSHLRGLTVCRERKLVVSGSYSILNESLEILFFLSAVACFNSRGGRFSDFHRSKICSFIWKL